MRTFAQVLEEGVKFCESGHGIGTELDLEGALKLIPVTDPASSAQRVQRRHIYEGEVTLDVYAREIVSYRVRYNCPRTAEAKTQDIPWVATCIEVHLGEKYIASSSIDQAKPSIDQAKQELERLMKYLLEQQLRAVSYRCSRFGFEAINNPS